MGRQGIRGTVPAARALALVLLPLAAGLVGAGLAGGAPSYAAEAGDPVKVVVVLDVSGSMRRPAGGGLTLLGGARRALAELTSTLPPTTEVGLRVYGSDYGGADRRRSCRDTRLLVPVGPRHGAAVVRDASDLRPTGDTPIGLALRKAADDLGDGPAARRVIVLISDGEDNCSRRGGAPCQVADGLRRGGVRVRVESVGIALRGHRGAQSALRCVATHTGGGYYDAGDAEAISAALERIGSDALGAGTPVRGTTSRRTARLIVPGAYRTEVSPGGQVWFRFRTRAGDRPRVLATVQGQRSLRVPAQARDCPAWRVEIFNPYGEGGTYPPYGNSGSFDGVGLGTTGASSSEPVERYSLGIDYSGTWAMRLSLAAATVDTCSQGLPRRGYPARFSLGLGRTGTDGAGPSDGPSPSESPAADGKPSAATKYQTPASPRSTPGWVYPVAAVAAVATAGAALVGGRRLVRRRRRGW